MSKFSDQTEQAPTDQILQLVGQAILILLVLLGLKRFRVEARRLFWLHLFYLSSHPSSSHLSLSPSLAVLQIIRPMIVYRRHLRFVLEAVALLIVAGAGVEVVAPEPVAGKDLFRLGI